MSRTRHAVSVSLGSSKRDKRVTVQFHDTTVIIERIGTDGDVEEAKRLYRTLDGKVDAFGMGGVDLYIIVDNKKYPLRAAHKLIADVRQTPVVDGQGLKHTLERRVFELAAPRLGQTPHFRRVFMPLALDRVGLAEAINEVADEIVFGDFMVGLGLPVPIRGLKTYKRVLKAMLPLVGFFPLSMLFYGSDGVEFEPKYETYWEQADLIAGDFMFMKKYMPPQYMEGKFIISNTTTDENVAFLKEHGVRTLLTTTPRYDGRSFGTNMMEAALTAYAGKGRPLTHAEINALIDELDLRPTVLELNP